MGYRLHYAKHYAPDWDGGYFSGDQVNAFESLYYDKFSQNGWNSEYEDSFEIDREDIQDYIKHLKTLKPERKNRYFGEDTNQDIINVFEEMLNGSQDDMIRMEWF